MTNHKRIFNRGANTVELPFLMSCALYLLDRRYWIVGVRYPWQGIRFDLVIRTPTPRPRVVLIEAKYRYGKRKIRPYEIERFREELERVQARGGEGPVYGLFMTNTTFSASAAERAHLYGIDAVANVPLLFRLERGNEGKNENETQPSNGEFSGSVSPS